MGRALPSCAAALALAWATTVAVAAPTEPSEGAARAGDARAGDARAADAGSAEARHEQALAHFRAGRALVAAGSISAGCDEFEASRELEAGLGTDYNLADCWERLGKLVSAHELFLSVAEAANATGQVDREVVARERAQALRARLPSLVLRVAKPAAVDRITSDGVPIERERWGVPLLVDPGSRELVASAKGRRDFTLEVALPEAPVTVTVAVPELVVEEPAEERSVEAPPRPAAAPEAPAPGEPSAVPRRGRRWAGLTLGLVGASGAGLGSVALAHYATANDDAQALCPAGAGCTQAEIDEHASLIRDARAARLVSVVGFGAGGAALLSATVLLLSPRRPSDRAGSASPRLAPALLIAGHPGAGVGGSF